MLSRLIFDDPIPTSQPAIVTPQQSTTWGALRDQAQQLLDAHAKIGKQRIGLSFRSDPSSYAALAALERLSCDVFLLDAQLSLCDTIALAERLRLGALLTKEPGLGNDWGIARELPGAEAWSGTGTITILTSGSTGKPKAVRHSWEGIARPVRLTQVPPLEPVWLMTFRPHLYAGLQVMLQCLADHGTLAVPDLELEPQATAGFMLHAGVRFASATPSYWRRLLLFANHDLLRKVPLAQITLGGEVVDQCVLDSLRGIYPDARLVHIYATTELGRCFSVSDGLAGFPVTYLDAPFPDGTELKVVQGELLVRSPNAMRMYDPLSQQAGYMEDWFATGDLVELRHGRAYFVGRKSEMINVAGSKVYPVEVERVIRDIPGILDVRVFGKASSIAGQVVACEVVAADGRNQNMLKESIVRICRSSLNNPAQPRLIRFVTHIGMSTAGKVVRQ